MPVRCVARAGHYAATRILTGARAPAPSLSCPPQVPLLARQPRVDLRAAHASTHCGHVILLRAEGHVSGKLLVHARPRCALPCELSRSSVSSCVLCARVCAACSCTLVCAACKCAHLPSQYKIILVIINSVDPARVSTWGHPTAAYFALPASSLWETVQTAPAAPPARTRRLQVLKVCACEGERGGLGKKDSKIERGKEREQDAET
jgi:hypothetical protein